MTPPPNLPAGGEANYWKYPTPDDIAQRMCEGTILTPEHAAEVRRRVRARVAITTIRKTIGQPPTIIKE